MEQKNSKRAKTAWVRPAVAALIMALGLVAISVGFWLKETVQERHGEAFPLWQKAVQKIGLAESWFYDLRSRGLYEGASLSPNVVILELTDASLNKIGRWPWTRTIHARYIDNLRLYGARVVMFDSLFPEAESEEADSAFQAAINRFAAVKGNGIVLGYGTTFNPADALPPPPELLTSVVNALPTKFSMADAASVDKNNFATAKLLGSDAQFGFISADSDPDGVFRRVQLVNEIQQSFFPTLALSGFSTFHADGDTKKVVVEPVSPEDGYVLRVSAPGKDVAFPLGPNGDMRLRFFGGPDRFRRVEVQDVLNDPDPEHNQKMQEIFRGKAVLFGSSAFGAHDLRHTPVHSQLPGMYLHANLFHAFDQGLRYQDESHSLNFSLLLYIVGILTVLALSRLKNPHLETLGTALVLAALFAVDHFYFTPQGYLITIRRINRARS